MILYLTSDDLKDAHKDLSASATAFKHFKPEVQQAIILVGEAMYVVYPDRPTYNYNKIYPLNGMDALKPQITRAIAKILVG